MTIPMFGASLLLCLAFKCFEIQNICLCLFYHKKRGCQE